MISCHGYRQARCIVVNVEYRLAPEHLYPAMMQDGRQVAQWTLQNKTNLGMPIFAIIFISQSNGN